MATKKHIAIFASGSGSNAQKIMEHFAGSDLAKVSCVLSNNREAYVLERAMQAQVPVAVFNREEFYHTGKIPAYLEAYAIDLVVLAGFLWLVPPSLIGHYPQRIINIHPALLPAYGGKGMYGMRVHEAVIAHREKNSGITIHYVNQHFDEGEIIFQAKCALEPGETPESLALKVHQLEHQFYPEVIENLLKNI